MEAAVNPIDAFEWAAKVSERGGGIGVKVKKEMKKKMLRKYRFPYK